MDDEKSKFQIPAIIKHKLAHAYVPYQQFMENYTPQEALSKGTLFPALWMPYKPGHRGYY